MNAIYCRVSTEEQARSGYSLDDQVATCRKYLLGMGLADIKQYIDDGYSGEFIERPAMDELREDLRTGVIKNVAIYDPDRLARNLTHMLLLADEVDSAGAKLYFVTGSYDASPEGKLFFSMRGAIAEFEKAKIRERTQRGKRAKAMAGKVVFNDHAYGYDWDKDKSMYIINEKEADTVRLIYKMYIERQIGVRALSYELKALGITNKVGKPFSQSNIHRILTNEMYAGTKWSHKRYDKKISQTKTKTINRNPSEWIAISVPAIVDRDTWNMAQRQIKANTNFSRRNTKREYLLRGIIKCGCCGYAMIGSRKLIDDREYLYYTCPSKGEKRDCSNATVRADVLDGIVWEQFRKWAKRRVDFTRLPKNDDDDNTDSILRLTNYLQELNEKQAAFLRWVNEGIIKLGAAEKELQLVSKEIAATQSALTNFQAKKKPTVNVQSEDILKAESFEDRRQALLKFAHPIYAKRTGWKPTNIDWWL